MIHSLQGVLSSLTNGLTTHLEQWVGWATLVAAALFGFKGASPWMPLLVAVIMNPMPYGIAAELLHGHSVALAGPATYTAIQIVVAYVGYVVGRLLLWFR